MLYIVLFKRFIFNFIECNDGCSGRLLQKLENMNTTYKPINLTNTTLKALEKLQNVTLEVENTKVIYSYKNK